MSSTKKKVSLKPEHFVYPESPDEKGYLIGSKCKNCGDYAYYKKKVCPLCNSQDLEDVKLSTKGTIYTFTIVRHTYPMTILAKNVPFITAQVLLPEKAALLTQICDCSIEDVKVGMDVELCFWKVMEDKEQEFYAPGFRPV